GARVKGAAWVVDEMASWPGYFLEWVTLPGRQDGPAADLEQFTGTLRLRDVRIPDPGTGEQTVSLVNEVTVNVDSEVPISAHAALANGARALVSQPESPRKLEIRITDANSSVSAGTLDLVGVGASG